jgi:hypothetical protein
MRKILVIVCTVALTACAITPLPQQVRRESQSAGAILAKSEQFQQKGLALDHVPGVYETVDYNDYLKSLHSDETGDSYTIDSGFKARGQTVVRHMGSRELQILRDGSLSAPVVPDGLDAKVLQPPSTPTKQELILPPSH